jgi:hypothetical protein
VQAHAIPEVGGTVWSIYVPAPQEYDKPFVLTQEVAPGKQGPSRNIFAVYRRHDADCISFPPMLVQSWMNSAWRERSDLLIAGERAMTEELGDAALDRLTSLKGDP